ncbi:MAG: ABC transporter permease [Planctomycetota bacterium]
MRRRTDRLGPSDDRLGLGAQTARGSALVSEALRQLVRHPLRTALTALTTAVAIAVTVNVISLVYGMDEDLRRDTQRFGRLTVDVTRFPVIAPGLARKPLGPAQVKEIRHALEGLDVVVAPRRLSAGRARGEAGLDHVSLAAVEPSYLRTLDVGLLAGRFLGAGDADAPVCVLDESTAAVLFPGSRPREVVGRTVDVTEPDGETKGRRVLGVLQDPITHRDVFEAFDEGRGARTLTSSMFSFRNLYVPLDALSSADYTAVSVVASREGDVDEIARRLRGIWPLENENPLLAVQSVGVFVRRDWMALFGATSQTGAFLSNVVWMIIVGVAVVMLSTLNLLTIRERYDELAIRRVEGARRRDVAWQVAVEGTATAVAGGLVGLPLGFLGAAWLRDLVEFPFRFEPRYAAVATGIAALIGLLASALPARRAASLDPVRILSRRQT